MHFPFRAPSRPRHALVCGALLALVACSPSADGQSQGPAARTGAPRAVVVARAERTEHDRTLELGGTLESPEHVEVAARIEGAIVSLTADLGDRVERGDILARITPEDFTARVAETEAELSQAHSELSRTEQLVRNELATAEALERARTHVRVAESQRTLASRQLRDTRVTAPFDGAIAERFVSVGAFVRVGTPLFLLVATSPLRLAIDVPERLASLIHEGTEVAIDAGAGAAVSARVTRVAPIVDPETRTFRALVEIPRAESATLRPGMYVRARIALGRVEAIQVPRQAVFEVLGRSRVTLVLDGHAQPHDVEFVDEREGIAIIQGIAEGALVVARGPGLLAPGTPVQPMEATESDQPDDDIPSVAAPPTDAQGGP